MLLLKSLLLICSAAVVIAKGTSDAIVSGAIFVGEDTTSADASPVDIYANPGNHATAAASVLVFAAKAVNYHPTEQDASSLLPSYSAFETKVQQFPGFMMTESSIKNGLLLDGGFTQLEKEIRDSYESSDASLIARSLRDLIPGVIEDKSLEKWILSLVAVRKPVDSDVVTVKIVTLKLNLTSDDSHTAFIPKQSALLSNVEFSVISTALVSNAEQFAQSIHEVRVPDFIKYFSSPKVINESFESDSISCIQQNTVRHRQYPLSRWMMRD
ncbi:hypothetical protein BGX28_003883 [Mortierella sp. GBA30]|nr:hypothetical protein BGX28_003883 [Mortierella sp. GBA30]